MKAIDLCQPHYQIFSITCLKLIIGIAKHALRGKISNQNVVLSNLNYKMQRMQRISSVYQYCGGDLNNCVLLVRKGVYPYKYMDSWDIFDETLLPPEKAFYSELNLDNISDKDYNHSQ